MSPSSYMWIDTTRALLGDEHTFAYTAFNGLQSGKALHGHYVKQASTLRQPHKTSLELKSSASSLQKASIIPASSTFDDYLKMELPEDTVTEEPVDPYSMETSPGKPLKVQPSKPLYSPWTSLYSEGLF